MKYLAALLGIVSHSVLASAGLLSELKVVDDMVVFKTTQAKTHSIPACVDAPTKDSWAVPLNVEAGQAKYAILVTALSMKVPVQVSSKNACHNQSGIELADEITMTNVDAAPVGGVEWVGYTEEMQGNFGNTDSIKSRSPYSSASQQCKAVYPGSRAMGWDDYVALNDRYPATKAACIVDAIQSTGFGQTGRYKHYEYLLKDGQSGSFSQETLYGVPYLSCSHYRSNAAASGTQNWPVKGAVLNISGELSMQACDKMAAIACVR